MADDADEDAITCYICFEVFDEPCTLPCSHSFCRDCLVKIYKKSSNCAFCRRPFGLPLPDPNPDLVALVNRFRRGPASSADPAPAGGDQEAPLFSAPDEVLMDILSRCGPRDLCRTARTCQDLRRVADDPFLWRELCQARFPFSSAAKYGNDWKKCYHSNLRVSAGWEAGKPTDFRCTTMRGHKNYIETFALYRGMVASGSEDGTVKLWAAGKAECTASLVGHGGGVHAVNANEVRVVSGSRDHTVRVWDPIAAKEEQSYTMTSVQTLRYSDHMVVAAESTGSLQSFDLRSARPSFAVASSSPSSRLPHSIEWIDGHRFVVGAAAETRIIDSRTPSAPPLSAPGCESLAVTNEGTKLCGVLGAGGSAKLIDFTTGSTLRSYSVPSPSFSSHTIAVSNGQRVAVSVSNAVSVFNQKTGALLHSFSGLNGVDCAQMDQRRLVIGGKDGALKVFDIDAGKQLYALLAGGSAQKRANNPDHPLRTGISGLAFDESRIVASSAALLRCYDFAL